MAIRTIKLPDVGEGIAEAELVEWAVAVGDDIAEDQVVAAVMTDKATVEIPSSVTGKVVWLACDIGTLLAVGSPLIRIETEGEADTPESAAGKAAEPAPPPRPAGAVAPPVPQPIPTPKPAAPVAFAGPQVGLPRAPGEKPIASPAVRRRARELGVDLVYVRGSGPAGRIGHDDLDRHVAGGSQPALAAGPRPDLSREVIKVVGLRRAIARRMQEAKRRIPHFAYVEEVDVTALEDLRASLNAMRPADRPKLTLLPFLIRAIVRALRQFPQVNAHYDDEHEVITRFGAAHVGIATQTPGGLMVPVVRHCEARDIWDAAAEMGRVTAAAREGLATRDELTGSTITITSLGALGGIVSTPVINAPEVAIVGVNKIAVRPVFVDGAFVPRKIMNLSSSFDHRVVDGHDAASFIQALRRLIETPATLFMEV